MRNIKKKLLFGITSLTLGGAERVLVDIANALCEQYDITIFSIYDRGELKDELDKKIKFKSLYNCKYDELGRLARLWSPIRILLFQNRIYRKYIKGEYDVEISFLEGPNTRLFSTKNDNCKKFVWIHNDITKVFGGGIKAKIKGAIDKMIYSKYDKLIFVSKDNMVKFKEQYPEIEPEKMNVIYNYIDRQKIIEKANYDVNFANPDIYNLVSVCRLVEQKGIDRFIRVHSRLIKEGIQNNVYVIGDGPEKEKLQELIKKENVEDSFFLMGKNQNPYPYIKKADFFCLLSNYEGYGMVLEEAKILGKRIIITDTAAREAVSEYQRCKIIENNEEKIFEELEKILKGNNNDTIDSKYLLYSNEDKLNQVINLMED